MIRGISETHKFLPIVFVSDRRETRERPDHLVSPLHSFLISI